MKHIAIFASGSGTNAQNLIEYFNLNKRCDFSHVNVAVVICNKTNAPVIERAKKMGVPAVVLKKEELTTTPQVLLQTLKEYKIDYIVLAGYLQMIPLELIKEYPDKIINIHPSLLPAYGGKGMYGRHVHEAVVASGEKESGITIHLVDEVYDSGRILFQARCHINLGDTPEILAAKIHQLEYEHFPCIIEEYIIGRE